MTYCRISTTNHCHTCFDDEYFWVFADLWWCLSVDVLLFLRWSKSVSCRKSSGLTWYGSGNGGLSIPFSSIAKTQYIRLSNSNNRHDTLDTLLQFLTLRIGRHVHTTKRRTENETLVEMRSRVLQTFQCVILVSCSRSVMSSFFLLSVSLSSSWFLLCLHSLYRRSYSHITKVCIISILHLKK